MKNGKTPKKKKMKGKKGIAKSKGKEYYITSSSSNKACFQERVKTKKEKNWLIYSV